MRWKATEHVEGGNENWIIIVAKIEREKKR